MTKGAFAGISARVKRTTGKMFGELMGTPFDGKALHQIRRRK
jgi:hypothetical protein